jgi:DNA-binding CsgD family transcriptional regulator
MKPDPIDRLTEPQREVLRRWHVRQSAKEIAIELGITHWAVNERLRTARRTLGASSSHEAAQMLARAESEGPYNRLVYDAPAIAAARPAAIMGSSEDAGGWQSGPSRQHAVHEEQMPFRVDALAMRGPRFPLPRFEGDRNDLTVGKRLMWIALAAFGIIVAIGTLVTISAGAGRTVSAIVRAFS